MNNEIIVSQFEESLADLQKDLSISEDYGYERDIQFILYHILCNKMPYLFNLSLLEDNEGTYVGRRIAVEYDADYKDKKGRFDIVLFGMENNAEYPLIAIELKYFYEPSIKHFENDFQKLSNPSNNITHPCFVYCDHEKYLAKCDSELIKAKNKYPHVTVYYIYKDGMKKY